jgi:uncharacterized GH25 family protein
MNLPIPVKPTLAARRLPILVLLFLTTSARAKDVRLENNRVAILGQLQVRLAFTDQNGAAHDVPLQQFSPAALNSLPAQLQQVATSVKCGFRLHSNSIYIITTHEKEIRFTISLS